MSELEAWNWLNAREEFILTKAGRLYSLSVPGSCIHRESVIECVIEIKRAINA